MSDTKIKPELLALILKKDFWKKYKNLVLESMFEPPMDKLYKSIEAFHNEYSEDLDKEKLWQIVKIDHPTLTTSQKTDIYHVVESIKDAGQWSEDFANKVLKAAWKQEVFTQIAKLGIDGAQGRVEDLTGLQELVTRHSAGFIPIDTFQECVGGIQELFDDEKGRKGWKWQLHPLQEKLGDIHAGHFIQLMARPDAGKTAFLVSSICGPGGWADQGATIDWYCNEESVKRTRWRCISSYTGMTKDQLLQHRDKATATWEKIKNRVRTIEIPFGTPVEKIAYRTKERKPDFVVVDQIDKLGVRPLVSSFDSETDRIRLLYIKFREIGKTSNAAMVGVCQASAAAEGQRIVTYDMAENSKTGKAAECDVFMGIGRSPLVDGMVEEDYSRWVTVSKSKLDSGWKGVIPCKLRPTISRFDP